MRIFPGKLDLDIFSVGGGADTSSDLAGQLWIKANNVSWSLGATAEQDQTVSILWGCFGTNLWCAIPRDAATSRYPFSPAKINKLII